ncbi:leucine-rich PPR motif-containing protein, mitochondrial [Mytilus galloprovincialis]|uniref:Leucine-rich PPR motif-containing protein, mitochondrial n=1 Tax=Mytilus galloprovincialis TaxID=29158 RepID=A0A8B6CJW3_MYTGA|nr:leucine-rich PPR motif-containing protein, mitochondrial [Mytilus galloprovincialis]
MAALCRCARFCLSKAIQLPLRPVFSSNSKNFIWENKCRPSIFSIDIRRQFVQPASAEKNEQQQERTFRTRQPVSDQPMQALGDFVHQYRRSRQDYIQNCITMFQEKGLDNIEDGMFVLRSTGEPLSQLHPDNRMKYTDMIWECIQKSGLPLQTSYFNNLLMVYLENQHKFSPPDILTEMDKAGLKPNRVTFQLILAHYCEEGDVEKASQILEHMKEMKVPLTDTVFNSLIIGHFRAKYVEGACKYVRIDEMISQPQGQKISFLSSQLFDAIVTALNHGHEELAFQIFDTMKDSTMLRGRGTNLLRSCIQRMAYHGHIDATLKMWEDVVPVEIINREMMKSIILNLDPEKNISALLNILKNQDQESMDMDYCIKLCCREQKFDWILKFLERANTVKCFEEGHIRFIFKLFQDDQEALLQVTDVLAKNQTMKTRGNIGQCLSKYIIPTIVKNEESVEEFLEKMKEKGYPEEEIDSCTFFHLLTSDVEKAFEFAKDKKIYMFPEMRQKLTNLDLTQHWKPVMEVMSRSPEKFFKNKLQMLENIFDKNSAVLNDIVAYYKSLGSFLGYGARDMLRQRGINTDRNMSRWTNFSNPEESQKRREIVQMIEQFRNLFADQKIDEAEKVLHSIEDTGVKILSSYVIRVALRIYSLYRKNLLLSLKYLTILETDFPESQYWNELLMTCGLLIKAGQFEEVMPHIKLYADRCSLSLPLQFRTDVLQFLAESMAEKLEPSESIDFLLKLSDISFIQKNTEGLVTKFLLREYIKRDDTTLPRKIVDLVVSRKNLGMMSLFQMFNFFIVKGDNDALQEVTDIFITQHSQSYVLVNLLGALVYNNKVQPAKELLQTEGLRSNDKSLNYLCSEFIRDKKIEELATLVQLTEKMPGCDRDLMLCNLIRGYVQTRDFSSAKDVLKMYAEEEVKPSPETINYLNKQLTANGMEKVQDLQAGEISSSPDSEQTEQIDNSTNSDSSSSSDGSSSSDSSDSDEEKSKSS